MLSPFYSMFISLFFFFYLFIAFYHNKVFDSMLFICMVLYEDNKFSWYSSCHCHQIKGDIHVTYFEALYHDFCLYVILIFFFSKLLCQVWFVCYTNDFANFCCQVSKLGEKKHIWLQLIFFIIFFYWFLLFFILRWTWTMWILLLPCWELDI